MIFCRYGGTVKPSPVAAPPTASPRRGEKSVYPTNLFQVGASGNPHVGAHANFWPDGLEMRPVDAEGPAGDQLFGHLPTLASRVVPASSRRRRRRLVAAPPCPAVAAPRAVVAEHHIPTRLDRIVARSAPGHRGIVLRIGQEVEQRAGGTAEVAEQVVRIGLAGRLGVVDVALERQAANRAVSVSQPTRAGARSSRVGLKNVSASRDR